MATESKEGATEELNKEISPLLDCVQRRDVSSARRLLGSKEVKVDEVDEHGMTALQHSAFKGDRAMVQALLDYGAAVNHSEHEHAYTALMFAALAGDTVLTAQLLAAGASASAVNSVGRTAAQMAAFVGNHACVSVINTFISKETVDYYTVVQGLEKEPKLPPHLSSAVHRMITHLNINPVGIALFVKQNAALLDENAKVVKVIELIGEKVMKDAEPNDILAFKLHLITSVLKALGKTKGKKLPGGSIDAKKDTDPVDELIKLWLRGRSGDGFPENLERFLRQCIREFQFIDSSILQQLVRNLAPVAIGDEPSAITLLTTTINGQQAATAEDVCVACGESGALKKCSVCKAIRYCDQRCQKLHWFVHKKFCPQMAKENNERLKDAKEDRTDVAEDGVKEE